MTSQNFYIYGFFLLLLGNIYAAYWNDTEFLNFDRRDSRRIRNRLVTFDTTDTDVEVAIQFNVPFIAVPTDRSLVTKKGNFASSTSTARAVFFVWGATAVAVIADYLETKLRKTGSVALAGVMIAFGSIGSFLWKLFLPNSKLTPITIPDTNATDTTTTTDPTDGTSNTDDGNAANNTNEEVRKSGRAHEQSKFLYLLDLLDATVNPTVCVQQYVCSLRKSSAKNLAEGRAASSDKIIAGIFEAHWILDIVSGTAIHDAIRFGESRSDCEKRFSKCGFDRMRTVDLQKIFSQISRVFG